MSACSRARISSWRSDCIAPSSASGCSAIPRDRRRVGRVEARRTGSRTRRGSTSYAETYSIASATSRSRTHGTERSAACTTSCSATAKRRSLRSSDHASSNAARFGTTKHEARLVVGRQREVVATERVLREVPDHRARLHAEQQRRQHRQQPAERVGAAIGDPERARRVAPTDRRRARRPVASSTIALRSVTASASSTGRSASRCRSAHSRRPIAQRCGARARRRARSRRRRGSRAARDELLELVAVGRRRRAARCVARRRARRSPRSAARSPS